MREAPLGAGLVSRSKKLERRHECSGEKKRHAS